MTKAQFVQQLKESLRDRGRDQEDDVLGGHERDDDDDDGGHSLGELLHADVDKIWADFSEKLRAGDVAKDENGRVSYHVEDFLGDMPWWHKYKMHGMVTINLLLMCALQQVRRSEKRQRDAKRVQEAEGLGSSEGHAIASGPARRRR